MYGLCNNNMTLCMVGNLRGDSCFGLETFMLGITFRLLLTLALRLLCKILNRLFTKICSHIINTKTFFM